MKKLMLPLGLCMLLIGRAPGLDIVIDAEKDDFYNLLTGPDDGWVWISSAAWNDNGVPDDDEDLSANLWTAWDENFFYVYEEVNDDYVNTNNPTPWLNDCLELKFDPDPLAGTPPSNGVFALRMTALDTIDVETSAIPGVDNLYPEGNPDAQTNDPEKYARKETDFGYVFECKISWDDIYRADLERGPVIPVVGEIFGFATMNHDNDDTTIEGSIEWAAVRLDAVWENVEYHGTAKFLDGNKVQLLASNAITGAVNEDTDYTPITAVETNPATAPVEFALSQNYPNPFNPATIIEYSIPEKSMVYLDVFDIQGRHVAALVNEPKTVGRHTVVFNGSALASGIYFYRLATSNNVLMDKMTLVR